MTEPRKGLVRLIMGAVSFAAAGMLLIASHQSSHREGLMEVAQAAAAQPRLQMLYKENLPDANPFEDFDAGFKQGKYKEVETDKNVFDSFDKGFRQPPYRALSQQAPDVNPFENTPDNYPFDETAGGHEWKHWGGSSPMEALKEYNALDTGTPDESFKLGDHTLGRPFHEYKPDKNVFSDLSEDGETYHWGATDKSIPEKNVYANLSPDSGYGDEQ